MKNYAQQQHWTTLRGEILSDTGFFKIQLITHLNFKKDMFRFTAL